MYVGRSGSLLFRGRGPSAPALHVNHAPPGCISSSPATRGLKDGGVGWQCRKLVSGTGSPPSTAVKRRRSAHRRWQTRGTGTPQVVVA